MPPLRVQAPRRRAEGPCSMSRISGSRRCRLFSSSDPLHRSSPYQKLRPILEFSSDEIKESICDGIDEERLYSSGLIIQMRFQVPQVQYRPKVNHAVHLF